MWASLLMCFRNDLSAYSRSARLRLGRQRTTKAPAEVFGQGFRMLRMLLLESDDEVERSSATRA